MVEHVAAPNVAQLSQACAELARAAEQLKPGQRTKSAANESEPARGYAVTSQGAPDRGQASLTAARAAWRRALLLWQRAYAFRNGPIVDSQALLRSTFWPTRTAALEALLREGSALDEARVDTLGIDARGMFALEWLLFGEPRLGLEDDSEQGARARALVVALARSVASYAAQAARQLGDGSAFAQTFAGRGQESLSRVVNQMSATIEALATDRIGPVLEMEAAKRIRPAEVLGAPSGISSEIVATQLAATEALYLGGDGAGLTALVKAAAPALDERLRERFRAARAGVERIREPLERVASRDRAALERALEALKQLEVALKTELASALGVTLTFSSGDGD